MHHLTSYVSGVVQVAAEIVSTAGEAGENCGISSVGDDHSDRGIVGDVPFERYIWVCRHGEIESLGAAILGNRASKGCVFPCGYLRQQCLVPQLAYEQRSI